MQGARDFTSDVENAVTYVATSRLYTSILFFQRDALVFAVDYALQGVPGELWRDCRWMALSSAWLSLVSMSVKTSDKTTQQLAPS